jgi:hypothetical protein
MTGESLSRGGTLSVLVSDGVGYVEERGEGSSETDELGREDVQVADGLHLACRSWVYDVEVDL